MLGAPAFPKITVTLPGSHPLVITTGTTGVSPVATCPHGTTGVSPVAIPDNRYVDKLTFNGAAYDKNYLKLDDLRTGGTLAFEMSSTPNTSRGTSPSAAPSSWSDAAR